MINDGFALTRFDADGAWVTALHHGLDDARLAAALHQAGFKARVYSGQPHGRMRDLVRYLARMRAGVVVQWVTTETATFAFQLARGLVDIRPGTQIYCCGPGAVQALEWETIPGTTRLLAAETPEDALQALAGARLLPMHEPVNRLPSPYLTGLLTSTDCLRLGLTANQDFNTLSDELTWLRQQPLASNDLVRLDATRLTLPGLDVLFRLLGALDLPFYFSLHTAAALLSPERGARLPQAIREVVSLDGYESETLTLLRDVGIEVEYGGGYSQVERLRTYGRNGFMAAQTGIYPDLNQGPGISHLEVSLASSPETRKTAYAWAGLDMRLCSAAVLTGPLDHTLEHLPCTHGPIPAETGGWPRHVYAVAADGAGAGGVWFDGEVSAAQPVRFVPYSHATADLGCRETLTVLTIRTTEDIVALEKALAAFHSTGTLIVPHPKEHIVIENACRWSRWGACSSLHLRRLTVQADGTLVACRDAGIVGQVGDAYDKLLTRQRKEMQLLQVDRGCATCSLRDDCSQCPSLPAQWGNRYCGIRQGYPLTAVFLELHSFPLVLQRFLPGESHALTLHASHPRLPAQYYFGPTDQAPRGVQPIIVSLGDQHFAWCRGTTRLVRLSLPLALMLEGWWRGAATADLTKALCQRFDVDLMAASNALGEGLAKLRAGGLLNE